jgi:hypothetical protein
VLTGDALEGQPPLELSDLSLLRHLQLSAIRSGLWAMLGMQLVRSVPVAQPAAGAEWTQAVPPGAIWEILNIRFQLVTSAVVANRTSSLLVRDGDTAIAARFGPQSTQGATTTVQHNFSSGYGATNSQGLQAAPLPVPPIIMPGAWSLASFTSNLDVGDQYSGIVLAVREWTLGRIEQFTELLLEDADSTGLLGKLIGG